MSVSRPARCFFSAPSMSKVRPRRIRCQNFHTSFSLSQRRRPRFASVKASEMSLITNRMPAREVYKSYDEEEMEGLKQAYTHEQMQAIEAGEEAIDPEDLKSHGILRTDLAALPYLDDLSILQPVVDKKYKPDRPVDPQLHQMNEVEDAEAFDNYFDEKVWPKYEKLMKEHNIDSLVLDDPAHPQRDPDHVIKQKLYREISGDFLKMREEWTGWADSRGPIVNENGSASALAPGIPRKLNPTARVRKEDEADPRDTEGVYDRLRKETGMTLDAILALNVKILVQHGVANQTRLGKIHSMYVLAVAGNGDGRLGIGQAKGQEGPETYANAKIAAIRNMQPIPRYERRTIYGEAEGKVSATVVKLMNRPPGFGLRCQHLIFEMARAAGIEDLAARIPRSRNPMNIVKATYEALMSQRLPEEIAWGRGKKLVDVRKVYYAGRV